VFFGIGLASRSRPPHAKPDEGFAVGRRANDEGLQLPLYTSDVCAGGTAGFKRAERRSRADIDARGADAIWPRCNSDHLLFILGQVFDLYNHNNDLHTLPSVTVTMHDCRRPGRRQAGHPPRTTQAWDSDSVETCSCFYISTQRLYL